MRYRNRVLGFLFFLSIITYIDRVCIAVAGTRMQEDLGLSPSQWGAVLGVFALSYAIFEIPTGAMGDRIGPRKVLTRIVLWWSAFTTLTGMVTGYWQLLLTRFAFGAGEAGAYPNSSSSISRWFPVAERGRAHGVVWFASRIGGAISPLIVVPIQIAYGWRASFFVFGVAGVIWAAIWYWWYRDTPRQMPGVTEAEQQEIGYNPPASHRGLPWGSALKSWNLWKIMLMYHTYCWGSFFYLSWMPVYLQQGRGFSEQEMKIYAMMPFVGGAIGNLFGGWLSDVFTRRFGLRMGRRSVGAAGLLVAGLCLLGTGITPDRYLAVAFLTFGYFSMDCMLPVAWSTCLDVGRNNAGAVTGAMNMAGQVGSFLSSVAFGIMVERLGGYDVPMILFGIMLLVSAFIFSRIDPEEQLVPARVESPEHVTA